MAKNNNLTDFVRDLADGFREKLGWQSTDKINPQDFRDFIEHSPSVGALKEGLDTLNWTKTITDTEELITCPNLPNSLYLDESTETPLFPLIRFQFTVLDPLAGDEEIRFYDDATFNPCVILNSTTSTGTYILPVFTVMDRPFSPDFPPFYMGATNIRAAGVRLKMEATWVQIGSTQDPMRLSCATMGGIK